MNSSTLLFRRICALLLSIASVWIWTRHSDVMELIVRQRPIVFGRYSQGHAGVLIILTLLLWTLAAAFAASKPLLQSLGNGLMGVISTLIAIVAIVYTAHFFHRDARYVETTLPPASADNLLLAGVVRHPKQQVNNLDSEQQVVIDFCAQQYIDCLALTESLRGASTEGQQAYFTYDQHWKPIGNAIAAQAIEQFLRQKNIL